jgi:DNA (cytosine-5)-methyltransferase 1
VENSPMLSLRGLGTVLGDLAALGFDAEWGCISAAETGAPHKRDRMWIRAEQRGLFPHADMPRPGRRQQQPQSTEEANLANARCRRCSKPNQRQVQQPWGTEAVGSSDAVANANSSGCERQGQAQPEGWFNETITVRSSQNLANTNSDPAQGLESKSQPGRYGRPSGLHRGTAIFPAWPADPADETESRVGRVVDGVAKRVDRLKALGNGQVPRVVAAAWETLT